MEEGPRVQGEGELPRKGHHEKAHDPVEMPLASDKGIDMRRMRINDEILDKYGFTDNCIGCEHKQLGLLPHRRHSEHCRQRIYDLMKQDEQDKVIIQEDEEKMKRKEEIIRRTSEQEGKEQGPRVPGEDGQEKAVRSKDQEKAARKKARVRSEEEE